jgi:polo-like kinase 4
VSRVDYTLPTYLSLEACDLISKLLQKDPKQRIPLSQVLNQPFFDPKRISRPLGPINLFYNHQIMFDNKEESLSGIKKGQGHSTGNGAVGKSVHGSENGRNGSIAAFVSGNNIIKQNSQQTTRSAGATISNTPRLIPFTTARLAPKKQTTKHGTIEILSNLDLVLNFTADKNTLTVTYSGSIHIKKKSNGELIGDYSIHTLPIEFHKKYRYASRFVDLIRSKTPKVYFSYLDSLLFSFSKMYHDGKQSS